LRSDGMNLRSKRVDVTDQRRHRYSVHACYCRRPIPLSTIRVLAQCGIAPTSVGSNRGSHRLLRATNLTVPEHIGPFMEQLGPFREHFEPFREHFGPTREHFEPFGEYFGPTREQFEYTGRLVHSTGDGWEVGKRGVIGNRNRPRLQLMKRRKRKLFPLLCT